MSTKTDYARYADARAEKSKLLPDMCRAFLTGGMICTFAEGLTAIYEKLIADRDVVGLLVSVSLIVVTGLLTGIGVFDNLVKFGGAGALVPITGFANAVVSSALDCKTEGYVLGLGANIFKIAGPVILYGTAASALYGIIYQFCRMI